MAVRYLTRLKVGHPSPRSFPRDTQNGWKVFTLCDRNDAQFCLTVQDVLSLKSAADVSNARLLFRDLTNKALTGLPLAELYDEKVCHDAHSFSYLGTIIKIFRLRKSSIRLYFMYHHGKTIILIKTCAKRKDKLTKGELKDLETIAVEVLDLLNQNSLQQIQIE